MKDAGRNFGRKGDASVDTSARMRQAGPAFVAASPRKTRGWKDYAFWAAIALCVFVAGGNIGHIIGNADPEAREARLMARAEVDAERQRAALERQRAEADAKAAAQEARRRAEYDKVCGSGNSTMAYVMAQKPVLAHLKAPSTASFPWAFEASVQPTGNCRWRIDAYVDAQNGFGAMLRTPWTATMQYNPERNTWRAVSVDIGR